MTNITKEVMFVTAVFRKRNYNKSVKTISDNNSYSFTSEIQMLEVSTPKIVKCVTFIDLGWRTRTLETPGLCLSNRTKMEGSERCR